MAFFLYITKQLFYLMPLDDVDIFSAEKVVLTAKTSEINEKIKKFTKLWSTNLCTSNLVTRLIIRATHRAALIISYNHPFKHYFTSCP